MSSKSLVNKGKFRQNGPASQHARKESTKNKFSVDFCFELTVQHLFSSDLPPSPNSVVYTRKTLPVPQKNPATKKKLPAKYPTCSNPILQIIGW